MSAACLRLRRGQKRSLGTIFAFEIGFPSLLSKPTPFERLFCDLPGCTRLYFLYPTVRNGNLLAFIGAGHDKLV
jgi:hypothetical protein